MVQVDVFWAYGIGASFAVAAARQIKKKKEKDGAAPSDNETKGPFYTPYFMTTLLYLSLLFAPSGAYLLWAFTSWETMHVGDKNLPAWLVSLFTMTNVTQGILGFYVAYALIQRDKIYRAYLHFLGAYFFMFFILVHGWDGTGYQRFFSETRADFLNWKTENIRHWLTCPVALTLDAMGILIIPGIVLPASRWLMDGYREENGGAMNVARWKLGLRFLAPIFFGSLFSAIAASLFIHKLGWLLGCALFAVVVYFAGIRRGGLFYFFYRRLMLPEDEKPHVKVQEGHVRSGV